MRYRAAHRGRLCPSSVSFLFVDYCVYRKLGNTTPAASCTLPSSYCVPFMASTARQSSVPPPNSPPTSKSRQASVEPSSTSDAVAAARARSVSVEPESLTTPKASKATTPAPESIREESVEPTSSTEVSFESYWRPITARFRGLVVY